MNSDNEPFDQMLSGYFHRELDGQLGKSLSTFRSQQQTARGAGVVSQNQRLRHLATCWLPLAGTIAAAAAVVFASVPALHWRDVPSVRHANSAVVAPTPATGSVMQSTSATDQPPVQIITPPPGAQIAQSVACRTINDGIVMLAKDVPVQKLRRQVVQEAEWFDVRRNANVHVYVPRQEVVLVALKAF